MSEVTVNIIALGLLDPSLNLTITPTILKKVINAFRKL